jgi:hypothetical protein
MTDEAKSAIAGLKEALSVADILLQNDSKPSMYWLDRVRVLVDEVAGSWSRQRLG